MPQTTITTQHDVSTVNVLERMASGRNASKEALLESLAQQAAKAYEAFERDVHEGIAALDRGEFVTNNQLLEELRSLGVDI